jgi:hypothetical protein
VTAERETLRIIGSWMEDGRTRLPDHVLDAVLDKLPSTPQRRPPRSARRITHVNALAKYAIAAAAVVVVAIVGLNLQGTPRPGEVGGVSLSPDVSPSQWEAPSGSPAPIAPTSGRIDPGRYRWTSPEGDVTFAVPDGWTATVDGIVKNHDTPTHLEVARYMPGSPNEVTHVYADACKSEGRLEPVDASRLSGALEEQAGTAAGTSWFGGLGRPGDPPAGQMVEIREEPGLDRSTCRGGAEGPLQIWADPEETTFFALPPGHRGMAYIFEKEGTTFVFSADIGPDATEAEEDPVHAIVGSFEFSPH